MCVCVCVCVCVTQVTRVVVLDEDFTWVDRYRNIIPTNLTRSPYTTQYSNPSFDGSFSQPAQYYPNQVAPLPGAT